MASSSGGALQEISDSEKGSDQGGALNKDLQEFTPKVTIAPNNPFSPSLPITAGGAVGTPVFPRRPTSPEYELEKAKLISRLEQLDHEHGHVGDYDDVGVLTKSTSARPTPTHSKYNYDDRRPERFLKPDFTNFTYLPDFPLPMTEIDVVVSLKSIDTGYKKIERVIIANGMPDITTTGSHVIKMDYLDYRTTKIKFIFTTAQLWGEFCAVINIDKGGRVWLNGSDPEVETLEAAIFAIMIRLFSQNPANRDLESELSQTQTTPAGLLMFMDTRFGYISNEQIP